MQLRERFRPVSRVELAVLVSGTTTMGIEILAGRILAPAFGSSIYTWGSIIGVFMAALSLGYHVGGKRAERHASYRSLTTVLLQSTVFVGFLLLLGEQVMLFAKQLPLGARYAPIVPSVVLFGPPVFLLGFISPYAAELSKEAGTGAASGRVFSIGTIGSIIGAFATTFVLIPSLSVPVIELLFGGILVAAAVVTGWDGSVLSRQSAHLVVVAGLLVAAFTVNVYGASIDGLSGEDIVHRTQTPYQELTVKDGNGVRTMYLNGHPQSAMYLNGSDRHVWTYTRYFHLPFLLADDPADIDRVLFIGGGGFTGPKRFVQDYDVAVDAVEIDPAVIAAAKKYFDVEASDRLRIHEMDGRKYLEQTNKTYDLIVLDAYKKDSVPFHLTTTAFMRLADRKLVDDGMLYANLISARHGAGAQFYRAEYRTMQQVFPAMYSFPTSTSQTTQNIEIIASKQQDSVSRHALYQRNRQRDIGINLSRAIGFYQDTVDTGDAPVLTDDRAPVDKLLEPMIGTEYVIEGRKQSAPS
jgi:spermidine synthase